MFKDEDGVEYEVVESKVSLRKGDLIVRPVEQPKQMLNVLIYDDRLDRNTLVVSKQYSVKQAKAVSDFIQLAIEYMHRDKRQGKVSVDNALNIARWAIKKGE